MLFSSRLELPNCIYLIILVFSKLTVEIGSGNLDRASREPFDSSNSEPENTRTMSIWKSDVDPATKTQEIFIENGDTLPARFNVDFRDIKEGKKIGEGNWTVHEAQWLGRKVAVKKFNCNNTSRNFSLTSKEVNYMLSLRHPNILKLLGFYVLAQEDLVLQCSMIMELMDCDLGGYIEKRFCGGGFPLSDDQVVYIMAEIARGMKHIHERGCSHRDLKPGNVLMRESDVTGFNVDVKIADFGSSQLMHDGHSDRTAGTLLYKAPEQFDKVAKLLPDKVDVFSFGALCSQILTGEEPYEDHPNVIEHIRNGGKPTIPNRNLPEDVIGVIKECLNTKPEARPDFQKTSGILDGALEEVRKKMPRPPTTRISSHSQKPVSKGVRGDDHLVSIVDRLGFPKRYIDYFIPFEELFVMGLVRQGASGSVYKVEWKGTLYAQKIFNIQPSKVLINYPKLLHRNIVTFMGYSVTPENRISIIMELLAMDLFDLLDSRQFKGGKSPLDVHKRWRIVREIAEGMKYLHSQGVGHGDLKPDNVVVSVLNTGEMVVKLIDFGFDPRWCTTLYAAPEILIGRMWPPAKVISEIDFKKSDVYTFGMVCNEILGGAPLLKEYSPFKFKEAILRGERPELPTGTSEEMKDLIKRCWHEDPYQRPTFIEICESFPETMQEYSFRE